MDLKQSQIFIWGGKSKSRIVIEMISEIYGKNANVSVIFDRNLKALTYNTEYEFSNDISKLSAFLKVSNSFVVSIGGEHGYARCKVAEKLNEFSLRPISLISKHAILDGLEYLGLGVQAMPGAIVHKFCHVGDHCIINTNATIDHDCVIGRGVHVMPGATLAGNVKVGDFSTIGTNATILPNITIGSNSIVGAGAVVTKNVQDNIVVTGVPARIHKVFQPEFSQEVIEKIKMTR